MAFLRPLRWKEGMFLRPHHLQQHDLFLESRDIAYMQGLEHYGWGLIALRNFYGMYRVEVHNWAGAPSTRVDVTVTFVNSDGVPGS